MDFTLPVLKFNAEQTPENSGPRYRPMRRKRIEVKSQEQTPQNIKNERRRQRFKELMNLNSSNQSGSGTSGVEFANSPQRDQNDESTASRGSVRLFSDSTEDSVVNSSVEGNNEPCSFDLLESQPEMPYSTQDRINQNQTTESQPLPEDIIKKRSRLSTTRMDDSMTPSMTSSPVIKRIRTEAMSIGSPAKTSGWGSPKSTNLNETNDDFSDDSFFEQAAQQIIENQRIATQRAVNVATEVNAKPSKSPEDDPMASQTNMMTQPSQRVICEASDDEFDESLDADYLSQVIKS